jgi:ferredoxin-NADP reductase
VAAPEYVLVAGGIGITPILAMARALSRRGAEWRLLYGGRTMASMAFVEELDEIAADRVEVRPEDQFGLLDVVALVASAQSGAAVYCCGPERLIAAVETAVEARSDLTFHCERFGADPSRPEIDTTGDRAVDVRLNRLGMNLHVPPGRTILAAVQELVPDYPSNCTEGYCGSCETAVLAGVPDHRDDLLSEDERAANDTMLICVSRSLSESLTLDI